MTALYLALPEQSRNTYTRHFAYAMLDAVATGILANAPLMALKGMGSSDWQMALNMTISSIGMFLLVYLGGVMAQRPKMPFVFVPGMAYAVASLLMAATNNVLVFLILQGVGTLLETVARPAVTAIIRLNYPATHRGAVTGEIRRWHSITFLVTVVASAWLLDAVGTRMIKVEMLFAGVVSALGFLIFRTIRVNEEPTRDTAPVAPFGEAWRIMQTDRRFCHYLWIGFLYAFGGMLYVSFFPVLFGKHLQFNYLAASFLIHVLPGLLAFLATGRLGRWIDRVNPWKAWAVIRLGWGLDPFLLTLALWAGAPVAFALSAAGRVSRGLVMGASWILWWQVGVNHFAPPGSDTTRYMGVILFVNGLARLLGPLAGARILSAGSLAAVLWSGGLLVLLSSLLSQWQFSKEQGTERLATMAKFEQTSNEKAAPPATSP